MDFFSRTGALFKDLEDARSDDERPETVMRHTTEELDRQLDRLTENIRSSFSISGSAHDNYPRPRVTDDETRRRHQLEREHNEAQRRHAAANERLREQERQLRQQFEENQKRIAEVQRVGNRQFRELQQRVVELSSEVPNSQDIKSFEDLDRHNRDSDEALVKLAKKVEPLKLEGNNVAIFGSVSMGKSTMINRLLGKNVAKTGAGEVTTECRPYTGLNFVIWDTPGRHDETTFKNNESVTFWKSVTHRIILIQNSVKQGSKMMKLFDDIGLQYDIVVNKFDLAEKDERESFRTQIHCEIKAVGLKRVNNVFFLSAKYPQQFPDWVTLVNYLTSPVLPN